MWYWILFIVAIALLVALAFAWRKWGSAIAPSLPTGVTEALDAASGVVVAAADKGDTWGNYAALTKIRWDSAIEGDPKAIEACDYLRNVVTAWRRAAPVVVAEPTTTDELAARLTALEAAKVTQTIPAASINGV